MINSPGCQSPITGTYGGKGVLIASPVGSRRADFQLFHASAASGFKDWASIGTIWPGQAGYSSLLPVDSLAPGKAPSNASEYLVLFESGNASGAMYEVVSLSRFSLKTDDRLLSASAAAAAADPLPGPGPSKLTRTPPMGWMSWELFRCQTDCATHPDSCINAALYESMGDRLAADGYAAAGYDQVPYLLL